MRTLLLVAAGVLTLAGCDFSGGSDAAVAPIASLQVAGLSSSPETDGTAPDIFFEIQDVTGRMIYRSETTTTAETSVSTALSGSVEIPASTMPLQVAVFDFDNSYNGSRRMARSATFTADQLAAAPSIALASSDTGTATFTVTRSAQ